MAVIASSLQRVKALSFLIYFEFSDPIHTQEGN